MTFIPKTKADQRWLAEGGYFDQSKVDKVTDFARKFCRIPDGPKAGQPFEFHPWFLRDVVEPLFGCVRSDGTRRFRRGSCWCP